MKNKEKIDLFYKLKSELYEDAYSILKEINEIEPISGFEHLSVSGINETTVQFSGVDTWRYGGYEEFNYEFTIDYLLDEDVKNNYLNKLKNEKEMREKKKAEMLIKLEKEKEEKEKNHYLNLKQKFEKI